MTTYTYVVLDRKGNKIKSTIDANSIAEARKLIALTGKTLISIQEPSVLSKLKRPKKITQKDLAIFCQQMNSMLRAGVTVTDSMGMVASTTSNALLKDAILRAEERVAKGDSMAVAMEQFPDVFPFLLIQMVKAGEESGSLDKTFNRMGVQFEKNQHTKDAIKKATNYPKIVMAITVIAMVVITVFVMPMFVGIFDEMGSDLPFVTKAMLGISDFIKARWYILLIIVVPLVVGFKMFSRSDKGKRTINALKMKIKILKNLEEKTAAANFARLLSTLLSSGMYMAEALEIVANTMENPTYKDALIAIRKDVTNGYPLYDAVDATNAFPLLLMNLIGIGEKTGDLSGMLEKAADYFEEDVDVATQALTGAIQPIMIVVMGSMVGLMMYAVYGPMMSMYSGME